MRLGGHAAPRVDGYVDLTRTVLDNADRIRAGIASIDGIRVLGDSRYHLIAMAPPIGRRRSRSMCSRSGDALGARGWHHDRQGPPDSLHMTVSNTNTGVIDDYLTDLAACVDEVRGSTTDDRDTSYSTVD